MRKWNKIVVLTVLLVLAVSNFCWWQAWDGWQEEEKLFQSQVEDYRQALNSTKAELTNIKTEFEDFKLETDSRLREMGLELEDTGIQLELVRTEFKLAKLELKNQEIYYEGKLVEEFQKGRESALPKELTYAQVIDMTRGVNVWAASPNVCTIVAMESRERWRKEGWKVGIASVFFWGVGGHTVVVFDTSDRGEIFMDIHDSTFKEVKVEEGKSYTGQNGWLNPGFDDTIHKVIVMW